MGKKPFIDKKKAVTFNLVYRSTEDADAVPERTLVEADRAGLGKVDIEPAQEAHQASERRYPPGHPLAWLEVEDAGEDEMSEARRRELIELGFPDDGYDYLRHMRTLGRGAASLEGMPATQAAAAAPGTPAPADQLAAGPSVFLAAPDVAAPEADVRVFDASALTVMQQAQADEEAAGLMGGVTAFSRARPRVHGAERRELAELEALMQEVEAAEEVGAAEGQGDLLDDFVLAATQAPEGEEEHQQQGQADAASSAGDSYASSEYDSEVSGSWGEGEGQAGSRGPGSQLGAGSLAGSRSGRRPAKPGSIASTYWREERHDRKNLLTVIDDKFEHLALEYDEDEIGDLEEQGPDIQGFANAREFDNLLDEFLDSYGRNANGYEDNVQYSAPQISQVAREMEAHGFTDEDAAVAVQKAHEALQRAEAEEDEGASDRRQRVLVPVELAYRERERWDCESVLSLRSNLDNHPAKIGYEPTRRKGSRAARGAAAGAGGGLQGMIRLNAQGIPLGVLPKRHAVGGTAAEATSSVAAESNGEEEAGAGAEAPAAPAVPLERRKGETVEEKKARKAAVKEAKRSARSSKKELKQLFKAESVKAQHRAATAQPQAALKIPS